jgi:hypothetical protein
MPCIKLITDDDDDDDDDDDGTYYSGTHYFRTSPFLQYKSSLIHREFFLKN